MGTKKLNSEESSKRFDQDRIKLGEASELLSEKRRLFKDLVATNGIPAIQAKITQVTSNLNAATDEKTKVALQDTLDSHTDELKTAETEFAQVSADVEEAEKNFNALHELVNFPDKVVYPTKK